MPRASTKIAHGNQIKEPKVPGASKMAHCRQAACCVEVVPASSNKNCRLQANLLAAIEIARDNQNSSRIAIKTAQCKQVARCSQDAQCNQDACRSRNCQRQSQLTMTIKLVIGSNKVSIEIAERNE